MRHSKKRQAILCVIQNTECHPTADWVYREVSKEVPGISLGTVYRNLRLLCESGEVRSYEGVGGVCRYDGCLRSHYHFRCERCGAMMDVEEPVDSNLDLRVAERTGLDIRYHVLEFRGFCAACRETEARVGIGNQHA